jgi:hypothetical protein
MENKLITKYASKQKLERTLTTKRATSSNRAGTSSRGGGCKGSRGGGAGDKESRGGDAGRKGSRGQTNIFLAKMYQLIFKLF